jgi:hypothetical protein
MKLVVLKCSPEIAVPMTVKMPEPITAPMPREVSDHGPNVRLRECAGSSASRISLSMDFRASSWLRRQILLAPAANRVCEGAFSQAYRQRRRRKAGLSRRQTAYSSRFGRLASERHKPGAGAKSDSN